ncbi:MAG: hypothetical protein ACREQA_23445 [Candidatus Binatia bacterium]
MNRYAQSLVELAHKYQAAEAQVVRAYFRKPRRKEDHLRWLRAQAYKEHSAIQPLLAALVKLYSHIEKGGDRHQFEELSEKLADETKHARLIMDLLEEISGKEMTPKDLLWLPEDRKLAKIRGQYSKSYAGLLHGSENFTSRELRRKDEDLERAVITLSEGGGGALYRVCSSFKAGGIKEKFASVFRVIYLDEVRHKDAGARPLANLLRTRKDYERARRIIREVSGQRLRMRNEQFGFPLSQKELRKLERDLTNDLPDPDF